MCISSISMIKNNTVLQFLHSVCQLIYWHLAHSSHITPPTHTTASLDARIWFNGCRTGQQESFWRSMLLSRQIRNKTQNFLLLLQSPSWRACSDFHLCSFSFKYLKISPATDAWNSPFWQMSSWWLTEAFKLKAVPPQLNYLQLQHCHVSHIRYTSCIPHSFKPFAWFVNTFVCRSRHMCKLHREQFKDVNIPLVQVAPLRTRHWTQFNTLHNAQHNRTPHTRGRCGHNQFMCTCTHMSTGHQHSTPTQ
jgi:hypothetical protein